MPHTLDASLSREGLYYFWARVFLTCAIGVISFARTALQQAAAGLGPPPKQKV